MDIKALSDKIFEIRNEMQFNQYAIEVFYFQYANNTIYRNFCNAMGRSDDKITHYTQIPFIPIELFKENRLVSGSGKDEIVFKSSGTTSQKRNKHHVLNKNLYRKSLLKGFELFFGSPANYHIFALLPSYFESGDSSLVFMINQLMQASKSSFGGFYLHNSKYMTNIIRLIENDGRKILLIGVSYALLDMAENDPVTHKDLLVMETGGMKGKRKEILRQELHDRLKNGFKVDKILSEYGMTELLSQSYSLQNGIFETPPWMKVLIREINDPLSIANPGRTGTISVIDLANIYSCSFINTADIGLLVDEKRFYVLGRLDNADLRGCNLFIEN